MLTGRTAFGGETISDTIARVLERDVEWDALPPSVPTRIRDLLRRCLQKDPNRRLRDIGDARIEIDEALAALAVRPNVATAPGRVREPALSVSWLFGGGGRRPRRCCDPDRPSFVAQRNRDGSQPAFRQLTFRHGSLRGARLAADGQTVGVQRGVD